jgi:FtsP/CotA-like multicopper oxidase with cupredoxin domain
MSVDHVRQQPRAVLLTAAAAALALAVLFAMQASSPALATSGGSPYETTPVVDTNPAPNIVETTIVADETSVDIGGGVTANAQTFNGMIPGPEFRLNVGDEVIVHFQNNLAHGTGIHWHGIELANASDGTPLTQNLVPSGGTFEYRFVVPRPGIYWYHPHHHASTNQVFKGLYGTIVVKDPAAEGTLQGGALPAAADTLTMALSDITVCKASYTPGEPTYDPASPWLDGTMGPFPGEMGRTPEELCGPDAIDEDGNPQAPFGAGDIPNIQVLNAGIAVVEGQTVLTNGKNVGGRAGSPSAPGALAAGASTYDVNPGQGMRLQLANVATTRFFRLRLTDGTGAQIPLLRVGGQGGLLDEAVLDGGVVGGFDFKYAEGEMLLDPGDRIDAVFAVPASASGVLTLWTMDFSRTGAGFSRIPTVPVAHFNVTGPAASPAYTIASGTPLLASIPGAEVEAIGPATGTLIDPATLAPPQPGTPNQDIVLTNQHAGGKLGINSVVGEHDFPGDFTTIPHFDSSRFASIGDTLELTVTNNTGAHHPFHLHGFSIQPLEFVDTLATGPGPAGTGPSYTFPYLDFRDNIDVPAGYTLRYRVRLDDRPMMDGVTPGGGAGRWVFHCHIFFHATFGMISELVVLGDTNDPPEIDVDAPSVVVNEGQTALMTGTYDDPDGDALTLTASVGTITDNGDGTWAWSLPTTDGPTESQTVTVTATDPDDESDSADFALTVVNIAPEASISSPVDGQLFQLADSIPVTAPFTDVGTGDTHTCTIAWGDGDTDAGAVAQGAGFGTCTGSHTYATGGLKTITVTITDDDGGADAASVEIDVNTPPDCNPVQPSPALLWSPNHQFVPITLSGATDADGDTVTLTVTGVTQDEALNGTGDGNTAPDASLVAGQSHMVDLRAERDGTGDGRVYRIAFGGDDGRGGFCNAVKNVGVPHNMKDLPVDSGLVVDSMP